MRSRLVRHYGANAQRGIGATGTTLRLPLDIVSYSRRRAVEGHQIRGYGRFDLPLLASYSRSGTNWIRYAIEWISERPTPGQVRIHHGTDFVVDRAHQAYPVMARHPSVVLVLRDYRECLLRHHTELWERTRDVGVFLDDHTVGQPPFWYIENVRAFDEVVSPKLLVYYEDVVTDPVTEIHRLGEFLQLDPVRTHRFTDTVDDRHQESVHSYTSKGHESRTAAARALEYHSQGLLDDRQRRSFDEFYLERWPDLVDRYLGRYVSDA